jgi:hypothetical protein
MTVRTVYSLRSCCRYVPRNGGARKGFDELDQFAGWTVALRRVDAGGRVHSGSNPS